MSPEQNLGFSNFWSQTTIKLSLHGVLTGRSDDDFHFPEIFAEQRGR
jgi:hypothetical protein